MLAAPAAAHRRRALAQRDQPAHACCNRDVLDLQPADLPEQPTALVANLPYNVAVPALLHLLAEFPSIRTVMVMVQAEVAERLAAEPGGKDYGVPSAKVRFYGKVRALRHGVADGVLADPAGVLRAGAHRPVRDLARGRPTTGSASRSSS